MSPLTIVIIVVVAGLVIWRLIASYMPGTDTRGGDVVDGFSPTYGGGSDSSYDPDPRQNHAHEGGSHGATGGWDSGGDSGEDSAGGSDSGSGDGGGGDSGGGGSD